MDDLISRQAAIDAVEKNACNTQRIMDAVNNLPPAQPEPQWIPCSERMPETGVEVLTYDEALNYIEIQTVSDGRWENQRGDWQDLDDIAAWMPLPVPYQRGGEEDVRKPD